MEEVERTFTDEGREVSIFWNVMFQSISLRQGHINEVTIKVPDNYVESGPERKLLGVTFDGIWSLLTT